MYVDQTTRDQIETVKAQPGDYCYDDDIDPSFKYDPTNPWNDDSQYVTANPLRFWQAFRDGKITADAPGIKKVMENFAKVFPKYAGGENFYGANYTTNSLPLFMQGKAAMIVDGGWRLTEFKRDMESLKAGQQIKSGDNVIDNAQIFEMGTFNVPSIESDEFLAPARTIEVAVGFLGTVKKGNKAYPKAQYLLGLLRLGLGRRDKGKVDRDAALKHFQNVLAEVPAGSGSPDNRKIRDLAIFGVARVLYEDAAPMEEDNPERKAKLQEALRSAKDIVRSALAKK
jgi:hypothetical protein